MKESRIEKSPAGAFKAPPFVLYGDHHISQKFRIDASKLASISVTFVTFANTQVSYPVMWQLMEIRDGEKKKISEGSFDAKRAVDWEQQRLALPPSLDSRGRTYEIIFRAEGKLDANQAIGLPLYSMTDTNGPVQPVVLSDGKTSVPLTLGLNFAYRE